MDAKFAKDKTDRGNVAGEKKAHCNSVLKKYTFILFRAFSGKAIFNYDN